MGEFRDVLEMWFWGCMTATPSIVKQCNYEIVTTNMIWICMDMVEVVHS